MRQVLHMVIHFLTLSYIVSPLGAGIFSILVAPRRTLSETIISNQLEIIEYHHPDATLLFIYIYMNVLALYYVLVNRIVFVASFLKDMWYLCHYLDLMVYSLHFFFFYKNEKKNRTKQFYSLQ